MTTLRFAPRARADIDDIWSFLAQESEEAADLLIGEFIAALDRVQAFPSSAAVVRRSTPGPIRRVNVRSWALFYRMERDTVLILRIVHGGRDMGQLRL